MFSFCLPAICVLCLRLQKSIFCPVLSTAPSDADSIWVSALALPLLCSSSASNSGCGSDCDCDSALRADCHHSGWKTDLPPINVHLISFIWLDLCLHGCLLRHTRTHTHQHTHPYTPRETQQKFKFKFVLNFLAAAAKLENQISCPLARLVYARKFMNIEKLNRNVCSAKTSASPPPPPPCKNRKQHGHGSGAQSSLRFVSFRVLLFFFDHFSNDGFSKF